MTPMTAKRTITHATFKIERIYPHARERVFQAFADHKAKQKWFGGPEGWSITRDEMDFRVGGVDVHEGGPRGGFVSLYEATYQDIVPNERIVTTYVMHLDGKKISVSLATVELKTEGKGTRLVLTEMGAYLDGWDKPEMREAGTRDLLETLGKSLDA